MLPLLLLGLAALAAALPMPIAPVAPDAHAPRADRAARRRQDLCLPDPVDADPGEATVVLNYNAWSSSRLNVEVARILLEERLGVGVELNDADEYGVWPLMAAGEVDANLEVWPSGHTDDFDVYVTAEKTVENAGPLGVVGGIGWYVPTYTLDEFEELDFWRGFTKPEAAPIFGGSLHGNGTVREKGVFTGPPSLYVNWDPSIIAGLDMQIAHSFSHNDTHFGESISNALANRDHIVFYFWTPHELFAVHNLTRVGLPAYTDECGALPYEQRVCDYPADVLTKVFSSGFLAKNPRSHEFLSSFVLGNGDQIEMLHAKAFLGQSDFDAACAWLRANEDIWGQWIPAERSLSSGSDDSTIVIVVVVSSTVVLTAGLLIVARRRNGSPNRNLFLPKSDFVFKHQVGGSPHSIVTLATWQSTEVVIKRYIAMTIQDSNTARRGRKSEVAPQPPSPSKRATAFSDVSKKAARDWPEKVVEHLGSISRLRHPNLAFFVGCVADLEERNVVVEYVAQTLESVLTNVAVELSLARRVEMAIEAAKGINFLHGQGLVHTHVRSSNFLVTDMLQVKVTDYFVSPLVTQPDPTFVPWIAPEMIQELAWVSPRPASVDVYSFGVVLWELMTRRVPYEDEGLDPEQDLGKLIRGGKRPDMNMFTQRHQYPEIEALITRAWHDSPTARPSMSDILGTLLSVQHGIEDESFSVSSSSNGTTFERSRILQAIYTQDELIALRGGEKPKQRNFDQVTLLFCDVVGFTAMSSMTRADKIANMLDRLYADFDKVMARYNVHHLDTIGDAYIAVGGLVPGEDLTDPAVAVAAAAIDMLKCSEEILIDKDQPDLGHVKVRIGVHTGPAAGAFIGTSHLKFTLLGDSVNTAARLESAAEPGTALTSEFTLSHIKDDVSCMPRGATHLKGKGSMDTFLITRLKPDCVLTMPLPDVPEIVEIA